jgi:hypothetical protein
MDSREYVCGFTITRPAEVPADFELRAPVPDLIAGVFLPRSDPDWLAGTGRSRPPCEPSDAGGPLRCAGAYLRARRAYPARVLLLAAGELWILAHPSAKEREVCVPLQDLESIECGRIILVGWIGLRSRGVERTLRYNRRSRQPVETFLAALRDRWLVYAQETEALLCRDYGTDPDIKFGNAQATEIAGDRERPLIRFFQPAVREMRRSFFRYEIWSAGDLIVLTNRRILWISDRRKTSYERYGAISRCAPLVALGQIRFVFIAGQPHIEVLLLSGEMWRVPVTSGYVDEAHAFAAAAAECPHSIRPVEATTHQGE